MCLDNFGTVSHLVCTADPTVTVWSIWSAYLSCDVCIWLLFSFNCHYKGIQYFISQLQLPNLCRSMFCQCWNASSTAINDKIPFKNPAYHSHLNCSFSLLRTSGFMFIAILVGVLPLLVALCSASLLCLALWFHLGILSGIFPTPVGEFSPCVPL